jgi:hypothetical protein
MNPDIGKWKRLDEIQDRMMVLVSMESSVLSYFAGSLLQVCEKRNCGKTFLLRPFG